MTVLKERTTTSAIDGNRTRTTRRLVAYVVLVAGCWLTLLAATPTPSGHPVLTSTSPGSGEVVKSPEYIQLTFDREVPAALATVRVINPPGEQVVFERPAHSAGRADTISVPMPKTRYAGTYAVTWTMPSSNLQPISGSFTFDVFSPGGKAGTPEIATEHDATVAVAYVGFGLLAVITFVLLAGTAFFVVLCWPAGKRPTERLTRYAWCGLLLGTVGALPSMGGYLAWVPLEYAFDLALATGAAQHSAGGALLARLFVFAIVTLGVGLLLHNYQTAAAVPASQRWTAGVAVLGCLSALAATWSLAGPRLPGSPTPLALAGDIALLLAIALPIGGLPALVMLLRQGDDSAVRTAVPLFSRMVLVCAVVLGAVAGSTTRGWSLAGFLALAVTFAGLGVVGSAWAARLPAKRAAARKQRDQFQRWIGWTFGGTAAILVATGALAAAQPGWPAAGRAAAVPPALVQQAPPTRHEVDTGGRAGQGSLELVAIPGASDAGATRLDLYVTTRDTGGATTDALDVEAALSRAGNTENAEHAEGSGRGAEPTPVRLAPTGHGRSTGGVTIPDHGEWKLALTVTAVDGSRHTVTQPLDVR